MTTMRCAAVWPFGLALAVAAAAPGSVAQELPGSLVRLGLPKDPREVPRLVETEQLPIFHIYKAGCPSDGGWAAAAFASLEETAETNINLRKTLATSLGTRVLTGDLCTADLPRFEAWLADQLRGEWRGGLLADPQSDSVMAYSLLAFLSLSGEPATRTLVRAIAMDAMVADYWRDLAARTMVDQRYGEDVGGKDLLNDQRYLDAVQSVLADMSSGPPLPEFQESMSEWLAAAEVEREREVARREGWATPRIPDECEYVPVQLLSSGSRISDLISGHYPEELRGAGVGGTTALELQIDEKGRVRKARVEKSSGHPRFDGAARRVAWLVRFSPALICDEPSPDVFTLHLRFDPSRPWR